MPVNGIELKEGQKWKTLSGRVATLEDNLGAGSYIFRTVYEDGEWGTVTKDGKHWTSDYDSFLRELIYDPEQQVKDELNMKFTPQPGDKIICNNGEEFICCTLETLISKGFGIYFKNKSDSVIFGMKEGYSEWTYWHNNEGYPNNFEWNIREVIPQSSEASADKEEEVKEEPRYKAATPEQPLYTANEIMEIIENVYKMPGTPWEFKDNLIKHLDRLGSKEYQEYLRLKAIYE